jgi:hypothetical protein
MQKLIMDIVIPVAIITAAFVTGYLSHAGSGSDCRSLDGIGTVLAPSVVDSSTHKAVTTTHTVTVAAPAGGPTTTTTDTVVTETGTEVIKKDPLSRYRVGASYVRSFRDNSNSASLEVGTRIGNTPVFIQAGVNPWQRELSIGLTVDIR